MSDIEEARRVLKIEAQSILDLAENVSMRASSAPFSSWRSAAAR